MDTKSIDFCHIFSENPLNFGFFEFFYKYIKSIENKRKQARNKLNLKYLPVFQIDIIHFLKYNELALNKKEC